MALTINNPVGGATLTTTNSTTNTNTTTTTTSPHNTHFSLLHRHFLPTTLSHPTRKPTHIVAATGKFTPRTGKFDSKNRRGPTTTTTKDENTDDRIGQLKKRQNFDDNKDDAFEDVFVDDGFVMPELPGDKPDPFEGPQWDGLGFFVQYMWAFGILFALISSGIAVATYNDGATDFKETPAYKESIQSQDLLEGPEASDSDVFESNPTEEAPALE